MLWISCNPSVAHRHGKTNGCPVEFPTAHVLFKSCNPLFWPISLAARKFALIARRHQQFYVCAYDIDDQNLSPHERAAARMHRGKLPVAPDRPAKTLEKALLFWFCRSAGTPAFHYFESEKPEQQLPRRFQIEPQILGNLLHRPGAIELRRELGFVRSQL